jgi:hypothetical protein
MDPLLAVIIILVVLSIGTAVVHGIHEANKNREEGVIADFEGLRFTRTELIEGYWRNATRHSLAGLSARVEDTGIKAHLGRGRDDRRVHVIVEGPHTAIVHSKRVGDTLNADARARQFVTRLNMASRQLEQH